MLKGNEIYPPKKYSLITAMSLLTILVGVVAITGWILNRELLTNLMKGLPNMKFNTGLGFIMAGTSLYFARQKKEGITKTISRTCSVFTVILGATELSQYVFHYDAHIDQLFVADHFDPMTGLPGRMAGGTALCFILSGLGISGLLSPRRSIQTAAQYCLHIVTLVSTLAMLGYLFQVPPFYKLLLLNSMALHTALTFFVFSLASTSVYPNLGLTDLFTGKYTGNFMARTIFPRLVIATITLAWLRIEYNRHYPLSDELGIALFGTAVIIIGLFLIWQAGFLLNSIDKKRALAEDALSSLNKDLEETVTKRTSELNASLEQLKQSEESFRLLVEGVSDYGIFMIDPEGYIINWNKGAEKIKGYTSKEAIGKHISIFYTPDEIERGEPDYNMEIARERGHYESEGWRVRKNGSKFWANIVLTPLYEQNVLQGFSKITRDVTGKKKAEEVSAREAALVQTIPDAIVYGTKNDLRITSMNKAAEQLFGIAASDARGRKIDEIVVMQFVGVSREEVQKELWDRAGFWRGETIFTTMDGRRLNVLTTLKTMFNYLGNESTWLAIYSDITELKTTEERLELAFEGTAGGLWDWNVQKDERWWSPRYFELLGYSSNEVYPSFETLKGLVHPDDSSSLFANIQRNLAPPGRFEQEVRYRTKSGEYKWFRAIGKTKFGHNGEPLRMVGSIIDIDEKKKAEQLIAEQAELIKMLPDGIIYGDMDNRIISLNKGAEEMFEITSEEARGKPIEDIISLNMVGGRENSRKELMEKGFLRGEMEFRNKSGRKMTVLVNVKLMADIAGSGPGWLCIYTDTTPLRLNEELKKALNKLEGNNQYLEQLAYISAHDIKAPIIALEGLTDVLVQSNAVKPEYREVMNMFINKIHQMRRTNHSLNNILKLRKNLLLKEDVTDQSFALEIILEDVRATLQEELNLSGATLVFDLDNAAQKHFPYVHFKSIFYNLVANAIKYRDSNRGLCVKIVARTEAANSFVFSIEDNGLGIDMTRNKDKIFGIFKRFHNHIEGTGVGLHIVKSIVEAYSGKIEVESEVEKGTIFRIIFTELITE